MAVNPIRRPDAVDLDIIACLREQPQMTNKAIASLVRISATTVANRIRALADDHVMRVVAQRDIFSGGRIARDHQRQPEHGPLVALDDDGEGIAVAGSDGPDGRGDRRVPCRPVVHAPV